MRYAMKKSWKVERAANKRILIIAEETDDTSLGDSRAPEVGRRLKLPPPALLY